MVTLTFNLTKKVPLGNTSIWVDTAMEAEKDYAGLKYKEAGVVRKVKDLLWPAVSLRNLWLVDGFIENTVGSLIKKYAKKDTVFLDVGCGDLRLKRYLPKKLTYSGLDINFSQVQINREVKKGEKVNLALASAKKIPLADGSRTLAASAEVFEHIPGVEKAIAEVYRILKPGGILVISIPNNYCYKYQKKGAHADHVNNWKFVEFRKFVEDRSFKCLESDLKGYWLPLPLWLTKTSYQLPLKSKKEFYNTNFFYVFKKQT